MGVHRFVCIVTLDRQYLRHGCGTCDTQAKVSDSDPWTSLLQVSFTPNGSDMRILQPYHAPLRRNFLPALKVEYSVSARQKTYRVQINRVQVSPLDPEIKEFWPDPVHVAPNMNSINIIFIINTCFSWADSESATGGHLSFCILPHQTSEICPNGLGWAHTQTHNTSYDMIRLSHDHIFKYINTFKAFVYNRDVKILTIYTRKNDPSTFNPIRAVKHVYLYTLGGSSEPGSLSTKPRLLSYVIRPNKVERIRIHSFESLLRAVWSNPVFFLSCTEVKPFTDLSIITRVAGHSDILRIKYKSCLNSTFIIPSCLSCRGVYSGFLSAGISRCWFRKWTCG